MTVLSSIPNGASNKDIRDTINALLGDVAALKSGTVTPTPTPGVIGISGTPPATGQVGLPYSFAPATSNGSGVKTFALTSGSLLAGLAFSTTTGAISGTPTAAGAMNGVVVRVTDSTGSASTTATNVTIAVAPAPGAFTAGQIPESRLFQRTSTTGGVENKGVGTAQVPITVTTAGPIYARLLGASGGVVQAAFLARSNVAVTSGQQMVDIPGLSATAQLVRLSLSVDGTTWQDGTTLIGITDIDAMLGQSLQVTNAVAAYDSTTMATLGVTIDPRTRVRFTLTDFPTHSDANTQWQAPSDTGLYTSAFMGEYGRLIAAAQGMPAGIVGHAQGARSLSSFLPGGDNAAATALAWDRGGGFARLHVNCAHSDAAAGQTYADRKAKLTQLRQYAAAHNLARGDDFIMYVQWLPYIVGDAWGTPAQRNVTRQADIDWCADPANKAVLVGTVDQSVADLVHQDQPGARTFARSYYRAVRPSLGLAHGNGGARLASGTRSGRAIVLPVTFVNGGTTLSTEGANVARRFRFFAAGDLTSPLDLDATTPFTIASDSSSITVNLATAPPADQALAFYFAYPWYDPAGGIYDNVVDGDGITRGRHVQANPYPVVIPAPSGAGAPVFSIGAASVEDQPVPQYSIGNASVETI